jgi:hypothetical protein
MPKETPEKLSNEIPQKLLDLIKTEDTALEITRICFENEIKDDAKIRGISYQTGRVLVGDLPPEDFEKDLEEKVKISSFLASKIAREINDSIFYSVRESLATLYKTEIASSEKSPMKSSEERVETPRKKDVYREPVE